MLSSTPEQLRVEDLQLDIENPRGPLANLTTPDEALAYLVENADIQELVSSIGMAGWLDYEPLIVLRESNIVLEGNRRLAALILIRDPERARGLGVTVPDGLHDNSTPETVRCWLADSRSDARDYIGFKHINGPFKWDSFAKAKYAADWLQDGADVKEIARRLGDSHNTVVRLVNGYRVLEQATSTGFDRSRIPGRFSFSHLYTALTRPAYRDFLGLPDSTDLLEKNPVDKDHRKELHQLMVWLFGQDQARPVIASQNPDLKRLAAVLPNRVARETLEVSTRLDEAYAMVEDKQAAFYSALVGLASEAKRVLGLTGNYQHDDELLDLARTTVRTVRSIEAVMLAAESESTEAASDE